MHKTASRLVEHKERKRETLRAESFSAVEKLPAWKRIVNPLSLRYFSGKKKKKKKGGKKRPEQVLEGAASC
jgi:hypothetical protein